MSFRLDPGCYTHLLGILKHYSNPSNEIQRWIKTELDGFNQRPDNIYYFAQILFSSEPIEIRQVSGFQLKNALGPNALGQPDFPNLCSMVVRGLGDSDKRIRKVCASILTNLISQAPRVTAVKVAGGGFLWTHALELLNATSAPEPLLLGLLDFLAQVCEDTANQYSWGPNSDTSPSLTPDFFKPLVPRLVPLIKHPSNVEIKCLALDCFVSILYCACEVVVKGPHLPTVVQELYQLASVPNMSLRFSICKAFVATAQISLDHLMPQMPNVVEYMLMALQENTDYPRLPLKASEFWPAVATSELGRSVMSPCLPRLVPILLDRMVYAEDEVDSLIAEESAKPSSGLFRKKDGQEPSEGGEEEEGYGMQWTLRKSCAMTLDSLSFEFGDSLLPHLVPHMNAKFQPGSSWLNVESAIMGFGAIATGCFEGMKSHLPGLIPFLIGTLGDVDSPGVPSPIPKFLLRSMACWTLSRYMHWIAQSTEHFHTVVTTLLLRMNEQGSRRVQEAACSAVTVAIETSGRKILDLISSILPTIQTCFTFYSGNNLYLLYELVGTLALLTGPASAAVGGVQAQTPSPWSQTTLNHLMTPLITKFGNFWIGEKFSAAAAGEIDNYFEIFPVMQCFGDVAKGMGGLFRDFAPPIFGSCLKIVETVIQSQATSSPLDFDFLHSSFQLMASILQGLGPEHAPHAIAHTNVFSLVITCLQSQDPYLRSSALAFIGDLTKYTPLEISPHLPSMFPLLLSNISTPILGGVNGGGIPHHLESACNNALWSLGEIISKFGSSMQSAVPLILEKFLPFLKSGKQAAQRNLVENAAIGFGRLCLVCPDLCSPHVPPIAIEWISILADARQGPEKTEAVRGLCAAVRPSASAYLPTGPVGPKPLTLILEAIASCGESASQEAKTEFHALLTGFSAHMGPALWPSFLGQVPQWAVDIVQKIYSL